MDENGDGFVNRDELRKLLKSLGDDMDDNLIEEMIILDHPDRNVMTEHLDLFSDVAQERVAGPPSHDHDGVNGDSGQVHSHRRTGSEGMGADILRVETKLGNSEDGGSGAKANAHVDTGQIGQLACVGVVHRVDGRLLVSPGVTEDALNDGCPADDRTEDQVAGPMHRNGIISLIILLVLEGDGD